MKLGEALTLRSQLQTRIEQLRGRLKASALVQEGEQPPEDPASLLAEFDDLATQLERLVTQINHTTSPRSFPTVRRSRTRSRAATRSRCGRRSSARSRTSPASASSATDAPRSASCRPST